jgi:hypothetical protein
MGWTHAVASPFVSRHVRVAARRTQGLIASVPKCRHGSTRWHERRHEATEVATEPWRNGIHSRYPLVHASRNTARSRLVGRPAAGEATRESLP